MSSLIEPIYIDGIITGTLYEPTHMARAVSGRIEGKEQTTLSDLLPQGYRVNHPTLMSGCLNDVVIIMYLTMIAPGRGRDRSGTPKLRGLGGYIPPPPQFLVYDLSTKKSAKAPSSF